MEKELPKVIELEKQSPIPLYYQVEEFLRKWISENMKPGDMLPSEEELCEKFQVSRTVIRQALNILVNKGIIERQRGKGTVVSRPKINEYLVSKLTGFYEDMQSQGLKPVTKVLRQELVKADEMLGYYLNLDPEEEVILIQRLRFVNDEPLLVVSTYLPYKLCPDLLKESLEDKSLYDLLENKYGFRFVWGERSIEAMSASKEDAKFLQVKTGSPLILLKSITYIKGDIPIEYYEAKHRADRSKFLTRLFRISNFENEGLKHLDEILNSRLKLAQEYK